MEDPNKQQSNKTYYIFRVRIRPVMKVTVVRREPPAQRLLLWGCRPGDGFLCRFITNVSTVFKLSFISRRQMMPTGCFFLSVSPRGLEKMLKDCFSL